MLNIFYKSYSCLFLPFPGEDLNKELDRLNKMFEENKTTRNLNRKDKKWLQDRIKILGDLAKPAEKTEL
jgi:hypothetical protein